MALALTALVGVASASAIEFRAWGQGGSTTTLNSARTGKNHVIKLGADSMGCSNVSEAGSMAGETASSISMSSELTGCSFYGYAASWATNGCMFRFQANGKADIVNCTKPMYFNFEGCILEVGNQSNLGTVTYNNTTTEGIATVTIVANLTGLTYTRFQNGVCAGKGGTFSDGTYTGEWILKGKTAGGTAVELSMYSPPPTQFVTEEAPATIVGANYEMRKRLTGIGGNGATCSSYTLSGTMVSTKAESITLTPTFKGCNVGGEAVPDGFVNAGDCKYVFYVSGKLDITGETCATKPMSITRSGCIATIGPQSGFFGFNYANAGAGAFRTVSMSGATSSSVTYTTVGPSCTILGTFNEGKILSTASLSATNAGGGQQGLWLE